jgi:hypothetical protein
MAYQEYRPEFDLGEFRYAVAKFVKLLIRARWRDDPGFMDDQALRDWELLAIKDDRILLNRIASWRLLNQAAHALGILNTEFLDRCPSGSVMRADDDTPEDRLMGYVAFLAGSNGGDPYHNWELLKAAESIQEGKAIDWTKLVEWSNLPAIRADLDKLPHPKKEGLERSGPEAPRPSSRETPLRKFPKMDGLGWEEVTIAFVSNDSVRITARGTSERFMFSDIGFRDGRKGDRPDTQWNLLEWMALCGGELRWDDQRLRRQKTEAKHKIKIIRRRLRAVVQIDDDPFEPYQRFGRYKSKFIMIYRAYGQQVVDEDSPIGN